MTATISRPEFETASDLDPAVRSALRDLLLAAADTKLLLGYHYGEWTFGTPEIEAAVASCSLSQAELGHVRLLHSILKNGWGDDPDALIEERPAATFASIGFLDTALPDWSAFVAANYAVDLAVTRVIHGLRGSSFKPLRMSVEKILDEERYHTHHGQGWVRTLAVRGDAARDAIQSALTRAVASAVHWFGPDAQPDSELLVSAGVLNEGLPRIRDQYLSDVRSLAGSLGLSLQLPPAGWNGWESAIRRSGGEGPADDILYHLRGSANAMFKSA